MRFSPSKNIFKQPQGNQSSNSSLTHSGLLYMMNEVTKFVMKQKRARRFSPKFYRSDERREDSFESDFEDVPG